MNARLRGSPAAIGLIVVGLFLIATQVLGFSLDFDFIWPFFVIAPGLVFLSLAFFGDRSTSGFIFPGMIITGVGSILLYQSVFDYWQSWAYVWALIPVFVGVGLVFNGTRNNNTSEVNAGQGMVRYGLIGFVAGMVFFEVLIFNDGGLDSILLPVALVAVGAFLLLTRRNGGENLTEKTKRTFTEPTTSKLKRSYDGPEADISPELRRKIDDALRDDPVV